LIESEKWTDPESEGIWKAQYPGSPYQIWESDPTIFGTEAPNLEVVDGPPKYSLDLVSASLRQRVYITRVMNECPGIDSSAERRQAISRYYKFLLLMKKKEKITGKYIPLVPTLDVDLAWHTHQLFPRVYHDYCLSHVGREINHNDTFGGKVIGNGLRHTSLAWLDAYNEPYTTKDLRRAYLTPSRVVMGILFPPYGIMMVRVGEKLKRAQARTLQFLILTNGDGSGARGTFE